MNANRNKKSTFISSLKISGGIIIFVWFIFFLSKLFPSIQSYGIRPRTEAGLWGIFLSPFLHSHNGYAHILSNSSALFVLSFLALQYNRALYFTASFYIILFGGLGTWIFAGGGTNHIGASGWIYGLISFLVLTGIFHRNWKSILISVFVGFYYLLGSILSLFHSIGSVLFFGVDNGISWEAHLFGFTAGIFAAWILKDRGRIKY